MDNFYVFGSNLSFPSPPLVTILGAPHQLCGQYSGTPPVGQISRVTCEPHPIRARYVFIQVDHQAAPSVLELCEVWVYGSECLQCLFIWHKSIYKNKQTNKWTNAIYRHKTLDSKFKTCIFFTVHMCIYAHIKSKTHMQIYAELTGRYWFNALSLDQIFKLRSNVSVKSMASC